MQTIPDQIIIRSLSKTANAEELKTLNSWLKESPENLAPYAQMEEIWYSKENISTGKIHVGWQQLMTNLNHPHKGEFKNKYSKKNLIPYWTRYAAAVFVGVLISSGLWVFNQKSVLSDQETSLFIQNVVYNRTGVQQVVLPDNSIVWINENSKLTYPNEFSENKRIVALEGKAFFDISKNPDKPFVVSLENLDVKVTGTEFYVESSSYETSVALISGGVNLVTKTNNDNSFNLKPGQIGTLDNLSGDLKINPIDTDYYVIWKDGVYRFNNEPLSKIIEMIEKRHNYIITAPNSLKNKKFTGRISTDDSIESILRIINKSYSINYKISGNKIEIRER